MIRDEPKIIIRLPDDLKQHLKVAAVLNRRSQNAEIVLRLEQSRERDRKEQAA